MEEIIRDNISDVFVHCTDKLKNSKNKMERYLELMYKIYNSDEKLDKKAGK